VPASVNGVLGQTKECTDDRRGVLTCNEGFCAVKPGDWCKGGWSCRTECSCCKKDGGKHSVATAESPPEVRSLHKREFVVLAQALDAATYGSCPKEFAGDQSCRDENSVIVVCDPADFMWRSLGKCVGGNNCCEAR
jgi:hypothetical protein